MRTKNTTLKMHFPLQKDAASAVTVNIINTEKNVIVLSYVNPAFFVTK